MASLFYGSRRPRLELLHIKELEASSGKELLCKIIISSKDRLRFRTEVLRKLNEYYLFPDLDGLGKYLAGLHHASMAVGLFFHE